jgi:hypothetical protein
MQNQPNIDPAYILDGYSDNSHTFFDAPDDKGVRCYEEPDVLKAMEEYAKEESIAFLKWAVDNHSIDFEGFSLSGKNSVWAGGEEAAKAGDMKEITLQEFYDLFKA